MACIGPRDEAADEEVVAASARFRLSTTGKPAQTRCSNVISAVAAADRRDGRGTARDGYRWTAHR